MVTLDCFSKDIYAYMIGPVQKVEIASLPHCQINNPDHCNINTVIALCIIDGSHVSSLG